MKILYKYGYWLLCSLMLGLLLLLLSTFSKAALPEFYIETEGHREKISIFEAEEGLGYVFLPSHAGMDELKIVLPVGLKATLGGEALSDGMDCSAFEAGEEYRLVTSRYTKTLIFFPSANVPAMFVTTASGGMDYIHRDKNYEESAAVTIYLPDGSVDSGYSMAKLKGRGNSTWLYEKKPYALALPELSRPLGMSAGANWVLLANATDGSNLHNKLVFDMVNQVWPVAGQESAWVELYLNGEYAGLYLLCEKVESGENRLDMDSAAGDFLCKIELSERLGQLRNGFTTRSGRAVEICEPRELSDARRERIEALVNELEKTIVSGEDLSLCGNLDLDSWARRYITDEISANVDSDKASAYFYYKDGKFYAGPVWDFDLSFGNNLGGDKRYSNPGIFVARPHEQFSSPGYSWYRSLCENPSFTERVAQIYEQDYLPVLEQLCAGELTALAAGIERASERNYLRWGDMFSPERESADELAGYISARADFLRSAWTDGQVRHNFRADTAEHGVMIFTVKDGETFADGLPEEEGMVWFDAKTGAPYDFAAPVTEDVYIYAQAELEAPVETVTEAAPIALTIREKITILSIFAMLAVFAALFAADYRQRWQERRRAHEKSRSKIST